MFVHVCLPHSNHQVRKHIVRDTRRRDAIKVIIGHQTKFTPIRHAGDATP